MSSRRSHRPAPRVPHRSGPRTRGLLWAALAAGLLLSGCDKLGIESTQVVAERREAEGKAIGGACRHAARAIEDCYAQNKKADKAAIFAGWREMNDYMRENQIEPVVPTAASAASAPAHAASGAKADAADAADGGDEEADPAPKRPVRQAKAAAH